MKTNQVEVKLLDKSDIGLFCELIKLFHDVFETKEKKLADKSHLKKLLGQKGFMALVALDGNKVIGGLTAYEMLLYYSARSEVYIYDMAVDTEYQRKGVGKLLIAELKNLCRSKKVKTILVEAHSTDRHAVDFYSSTGGEAEEVIHFNYDL